MNTNVKVIGLTRFGIKLESTAQDNIFTVIIYLFWYHQFTPDQLETLPNINNTLFLSLLLIYFNVISSFEAQKSGTAYPINLNNKIINSLKINTKSYYLHFKFLSIWIRLMM